MQLGLAHIAKRSQKLVELLRSEAEELLEMLAAQIIDHVLRIFINSYKLFRIEISSTSLRCSCNGNGYASFCRNNKRRSLTFFLHEAKFIVHANNVGHHYHLPLRSRKKSTFYSSM